MWTALAVVLLLLAWTVWSLVRLSRLEARVQRARTTLDEIFADHIKPLNVPAWYGAMIGHQMQQWTLPVGADVQVDAAKGTITMLEPAVE